MIHHLIVSIPVEVYYFAVASWLAIGAAFIVSNLPDRADYERNHP